MGVLVAREGRGMGCDMQVKMPDPEGGVGGGDDKDFWGERGGGKRSEEGVEFGKEGVGYEVYWGVDDCQAGGVGRGG